VFEKALIFGLYSVTPVHAGSGAELSVIDLPIQRERHTGFPTIWGQSLKGVFRRAYYEKLNGSEKTEVIFGPPTDRAHEHAGSISVGDAKILLFPVRSLKGVFAYVTCPIVLERFIDDIEFALKINNNKNKNEVEMINKAKIFVSQLSLDETNTIAFEENLIVRKNDKNYVILEDLLLEIKEIHKNCDLVGLLRNILPENVKDRIGKKLVIVSDDVFTAFVTTTTEIVARIKIDASTGTVQKGALWYEEYLPSDTLLYSLVTIGKPRIWGKNDEERKKNEEKIKKAFGCNDLKDCIEKIANELKKLEGYLQIGGNETIGKGFVKAVVWGDKNEYS